MHLPDVGILLMDDVQSMRGQIKEMLKSMGFQKVTVVANGEEAKQAVEQNSFHLIIADWYVAPTTGMQLLKYLREHPQMHAVAFVMLTGENVKEKVIQAIAEGVDGYIMKPVNAAQLQKTVFDVLIKKKVIG